MIHLAVHLSAVHLTGYVSNIWICGVSSAELSVIGLRLKSAPNASDCTQISTVSDNAIPP